MMVQVKSSHASHRGKKIVDLAPIVDLFCDLKILLCLKI